MSGHTPGPWIIEEGHIQRDSGGIRYWQVSDGQDAIACNQFCYADESQANARLIAAAPSLLGPAPNAADFLEQYANYIRTVKADDLELHPYLPAIEQTVQDLRAAIELAKTGGAA